MQRCLPVLLAAVLASPLAVQAPPPAARPGRADDLAAVAPRVDAELPPLVELYRQLHAHPELAGNEVRTAARLARELRAAGCDVTDAGAPEPLVRHDPGAYTPALVNPPELAAKLAAVLRAAVGPDRVHVRPPSMGGEDFSRFARAGVPTFYYFLGSVAPERYEAARQGGPALPPTHSPWYSPVPGPTIRTGVLTMAMEVLELK